MSAKGYLLLKALWIAFHTILYYHSMRSQKWWIVYEVFRTLPAKHSVDSIRIAARAQRLHVCVYFVGAYNAHSPRATICNYRQRHSKRTFPIKYTDQTMPSASLHIYMRCIASHCSTMYCKFVVFETADYRTEFPNCEL